MRLYFVSSEVTKNVSHLDLSRQILGDPVFAFDCTVHQDVVNVKISSCCNIMTMHDEKPQNKGRLAIHIDAT